MVFSVLFRTLGDGLAKDMKTSPLICEQIDVMGVRWSSNIPSGKHTKSYWKWPFIVDLPNKNCDLSIYLIPYAPWCWYIYLHDWVILFGQMLVNMPAPWSIWDKIYCILYIVLYIVYINVCVLVWWDQIYWYRMYITGIYYIYKISIQ